MATVYRNTSERFLIEFLTDGYVDRTRTKRFISFSYDKDSGGQDEFGPVCIYFDLDLLNDQGIIDIYYEPGFFEMYPDVAGYVLGFRTMEDYNINVYDEEGTELDDDLLYEEWVDHIYTFEQEEELVLKKLKYHPGIIQKVEFRKTPSKEVIELLKKYRIPFGGKN